MRSRTYLRIPLPLGLSITIGDRGSVSTSLQVGKVRATMSRSAITVVTRLGGVFNVSRWRR